MGILLFITASRPALRPTQPPNQWLQGALTPGVKQPAYLHLVSKLRTHGIVFPLPQYISMVWLVKHMDFKDSVLI